MMLACRATGSNTLQLAADQRAVVTADVGTGGVSWYFSPSSSWGFFPTGQPVQRSSCDIHNASPAQRLCWHTSGNNIADGYRCGADDSLNGSTSYERLVFVY